jgi:EARP and GARP complex-interacting protein 1
MFSNQSADLSLHGPCRALDAVKGDKVNNRFIVGTCSVNSNHNYTNNNNNTNSSLTYHNHNNNNSNEVHNRLYCLNFHSETNELCIESEWDHFTGSVGTVCCHPTDPSLVLTASEQNGVGVTLWKLPLPIPSEGRSENNQYREYDDDEGEYDKDPIQYDNYGNKDNNNCNTVTEMERLATLQQHPDDGDDDNEGHVGNNNNTVGGVIITDIAWRSGMDDGDNVSSGDVLTIDTNGDITQWDISFGAADPTNRASCMKHRNNTTTTTNCNKPKNPPPPRIAWDPHSNSGDTLAASFGTDVHIFDWRIDTSIPTGTVDVLHNCHRYGVTDLHYNPNKPYVVATSGKDGLIKFWDIRSTKQQPLLTARGGHSHWIKNVQYNPFHDQLVLSTGTDSVVNLWRFSTISSAPLLTYDDDDDVDFGSPTTNAATTTGRDTSTGTNNNNSNNNNNLITTAGRSSGESAANALVGRYEHGGEPVYAATWGAADAWIYLTIGYDGKAVLNHVPSQEKYKILL